MTENVPATEGPRIVLFGAAGAGKSSLLGALAQTAKQDQPAPGEQRIDQSAALAELQKGTYQGPQQETKDDVVPYPVSLQANTPSEATFIDCAGRVAQAYLAGQRSLDERAR